MLKRREENRIFWPRMVEDENNFAKHKRHENPFINIAKPLTLAAPVSIKVLIVQQRRRKRAREKKKNKPKVFPF